MTLLLWWPAASQSQAILANEVTDPRTFGYVVGDKIRREVRVSLRSGYRLDEASLPKPGRLDRWLEVATPEVGVEPTSDGQRYRLVLTYQLFNAPQALETVTVPQQNLRIVGESQDLTTLIPALRVTIAPLTSAIPLDRLTGASLVDDRPPGPLPVAPRQARLAWTVAALLVLLLYMASRRSMLAFVKRANLPFSRAVRELKQLHPGTAAPAYAAGLKIVHEALNGTAGRAVFAHNLDDFLAAQPAYAGLRDELHWLFAASGRVFFAGKTDDAPSRGEWPRLLQLSRSLRSVERHLQRRLSTARGTA
ncbi:MAG: hypothetical protein ACREQ1_13530 [Woeseiaceae bacterium]